LKCVPLSPTLSGNILWPGPWFYPWRPDNTKDEATLARLLNRLTVKKIEKLLRNGVVGVHADGAGLYLRIRSKTSASWEKQYQPRGAVPRITKTGKVGWPVKYMGLGSAFVITLDEAREKNRQANKLLIDKVDPLTTRRAERAQRIADATKVITFGEAARRYYNNHCAAWDDRHAAQWRQSVLGETPSGAAVKRDLCRAMRAMPVTMITKQIVCDVLRPIWLTHHESASRLRNRIEAVLDMATAQEFRTGDNPAALAIIREWLPKPEKRKTKHLSGVAYKEMPNFVAALRRLEGSAERATEFLVYTLCRTTEVLGAKWSEIDMDEKTWTVPAERMKNHEEHVVPLTQPALDLLRALPRDDRDLVFLSSQPGKPLNQKAMLRVIRRMGFGETVHGLRGTFSTWAHETQNVDIAPLHVIEAALAHKIGSAISEAYRHTDLLAKRRKLMDAWANYCTGPVVESGEVVPIRAAR
jgi:integrase